MEGSGMERFGEQGLAIVGGLLAPRDLARARCTSKRWCEVLSRLDLRTTVFLVHWGLAGLESPPASPSLLERAGLATFAHKHTVQPDDSVQRLAVRYGVDAAHVRRLNGLMTDFSLLSRTHVYLPVLSAAELAGRRVAFETDRTCRRELAVLLPRDDCCCQEQQEEEEQEEGGGKGERETEEARAWRRQGHGGKVGGPTAEQESLAPAVEDKVCRALARSLRLDPLTAKYYLREAGGDLKAAMEAAAEDAAWEVAAAAPFVALRKRPILDFINDDF